MCQAVNMVCETFMLRPDQIPGTEINGNERRINRKKLSAHIDSHPVESVSYKSCGGGGEIPETEGPNDT